MTPWRLHRSTHTLHATGTTASSPTNSISRLTGSPAGRSPATSSRRSRATAAAIRMSPRCTGSGVTLDLLELKTEIREFLTSRRGRISPGKAGITAYGAGRVPGLRRSELATLAGVSVQYYTRIERGNLSGVSDNVIEAIAGALQLDDAERAHLFDLARASQPSATTRRRRATRQQVRIADETVAIMRRSAGADPHDRRLPELVGELSIRSEAFRTDGRYTTCASTTPAPSASCTSRRRPDPELRTVRPRSRKRADDVHLHRRPRHPLSGGS